MCIVDRDDIQKHFLVLGKEASPQESAAQLKYLFPKASNQFHEECLELFKTKLNLCQECLHTEFFVQHNGPDMQQYYYQNQICIFVESMLSSNKLYIGITSRVFRDYVCRWLVFVYNYYIRQSRSVDDDFETFDTSGVREVVHESDGIDELDNCKTPSRLEIIHNVEVETHCFSCNSRNLMYEFLLRLTGLSFILH